MSGRFPLDIIAAAQSAEAKWRVPASVSLAQWALESEWGQRTMGPANNCFGLKPWRTSQPTVMVPTHEVIDGVREPVNAKFCRFDSIAACFDAHGEFLAVNHRYKPAFATADGLAFARAIAKAGYATDPDYAEKLVALMSRHGLLAYDKPSVSPPTAPRTQIKAAAGAAVVVAAGSGAAAIQTGHPIACGVGALLAAVAAIGFVLHLRKA